MFANKLFEIYHDSIKNLHAYNLSGAAKFLKTLSRNLANFHELVQNPQKLTAAAVS